MFRKILSLLFFGFTSSLFGGNIPKLTLTEVRFSEGLPENWTRSVPERAKKAEASFGERINLEKIAGRAAKAGDEGVVFFVFDSAAETSVQFGIGADWWCEAFVNGDRRFSSMKTGNGTSNYSTKNHFFTASVRKGRNLLAVRVKRGSDSWVLCCGPDAFKMYQGTMPWKKGPLPAAKKRPGASYRIIVLGDTHFDTDPEIYHKNYVPDTPRLGKIQRAEFARNTDMWKKRNPRMMEAAARQKNDSTLAVIQVGDLIQGDCGDPAVHSKMLLDTLEMFKKKFPGLPLLTTTGNHDIRGTGAAKAYRDTMPSYHSRELKKKITGTTFYTVLGGDLYLFIDFNAPDLDMIFRAMQEKARYKFVICHGPVLPADCRSYRWFLMGSNDPWRYTLHDLFMKNDVIVLTGHIHDLELTECVTKEGRITQLMANSVWSDESLADFKTVCSDPSEYGKNQTVRDGKKLFAEYKNVITRYWRAKGAGFYVIDVSPGGITTKYFGGASGKVSKEIKLR